MHEPGGLGSAALYQWSPRIHINTAQNEPWIMLSKEPYRSLTSHMTATPFTQTDPDRHIIHSNGAWPPHHSLKRRLTEEVLNALDRLVPCTHALNASRHQHETLTLRSTEFWFFFSITHLESITLVFEQWLLKQTQWIRQWVNSRNR